MDDFFGKFIAGAKVFRVLFGMAFLFFLVALIGAVGTRLPTGRMFVDLILWWLGLCGAVLGGALLAARLRLRVVGQIEPEGHFPFANLLADTGGVLIGLLVAGYFLPALFAQKPDHTGDALVFGIGCLIFVLAAFDLVRHVTRP